MVKQNSQHLIELYKHKKIQQLKFSWLVNMDLK